MIYLHSEVGNKLEGLNNLDIVMPLGIDFFTFDFSGCGNSEGDFVTFGWKEVHDLHTVLTYLKIQGLTSKVVIWGRSMGAATALLYNHKSPLLVDGLILDSGYCAFKEVA